jgi:triacylglycerol lipase
MSTLAFEADARGYSPTNAYALAQMSSLAYAKRGPIKSKIKSWGFDEDTLEVLTRGDTQAFVAANADCVIVAFRGTEPVLAEWLGDLQFHLTGGPLGKVHEGFAAGLNAVWLDLLQALRDLQSVQTRPRSLWFTGHSLGGALATLAVAKMIERAEPVDALYTYGSPRCGDGTFASAFNANFDRAYRLVNRNDLVTRVPPRPLYHHVGIVKYIDGSGILRDEQDGWLPFLRRVRFNLEDLRKLDPGAIKDHAIAEYIAALGKLLTPAIADAGA